ncbi:conjugal transfer protein TraA, partial [Vibrio parahaemolyticus]|nr:conjugal transfer protein TraA [Vibrio parahaemolyticus]
MPTISLQNVSSQATHCTTTVMMQNIMPIKKVSNKTIESAVLKAMRIATENLS